MFRTTRTTTRVLAINPELINAFVTQAPRARAAGHPAQGA